MQVLPFSEFLGNEPPFMKKIKFSGRELAALRAIDFGNGALGAEILEKTRIVEEELVEVIQGLMEAGFVETNPPLEMVKPEAFLGTLFEVNPGYVQEIKIATRRSSASPASRS